MRPFSKTCLINGSAAVEQSAVQILTVQCDALPVHLTGWEHEPSERQGGDTSDHVRHYAHSRCITPSMGFMVHSRAPHKLRNIECRAGRYGLKNYSPVFSHCKGHQHSACCFLCTVYYLMYFILTLPVKPRYFILKDFVRCILF